jgi:hypothetical protein
MDIATDDRRFDRYYRRLQLGLRLLSHGARAQTASDWSELTPDRLVTLKRRWLPEAGDGFRGPAPTSFQMFLRSNSRTVDATLFSIIHTLLARRPASSHADVLRPCLDSGERLCDAYEAFREWEPDSDMEFDHAVLLARGAALAETIELIQCPTCQSALLIDKLTKRRQPCAVCRRRRRMTSP